MDNLNIALDDNFSLWNLLIATVPLLATLAGFLISLGEAAYYRIMTECGAPSLQSFALRFVVAGFASVLVVAASFQFAIASQVLIAVVTLCFAGALLAIFSLRREIALPELLVITAAASVLLAECVYLATGSQPLSEFVPSGENTPVIQVSLLWLVAYLAAACGLFFEVGFFSARLRKIYLVDEDESWIVLTACAGGKAFLRSIVQVKNGACFTGDLVRFVPMEELPSYRWRKFKRVAIRPMVDGVAFDGGVAVFHSGGKRFIRRSGVGVAGALQRKALLRAGCAEVRLATEHGDLLHINTAGLGGALRMIECHWRGIPVVVTAHNIAELLPGTFRFLQSRVAVRAYHRWLKWFYCSADVMIAPSPYARKMLIDGYGVKGSVKVISNGVDIEAFRNVEQGDVDRALSLLNDSRGTKNKIDLSKQIILSVGMQVDRKGMAEFVDLAERMPHFEFVWVGETMTFA